MVEEWVGQRGRTWSKAPVFDGKAPVSDQKAPVFDREVPLSERRHLLESAKIDVFGLASGGLAGAARGPRPATAALASAQGRPTPLGRPGWVM